MEKLPPPIRVHEQPVEMFSAVAPAQRFLSAFGEILPHFRPHHHRLRAMPITARWPTVSAPETKSPAGPRSPEPPRTGPISQTHPTPGWISRPVQVNTLTMPKLIPGSNHQDQRSRAARRAMSTCCISSGVATPVCSPRRDLMTRSIVVTTAHP
jgi:hypothetical protein